MIEKLNDHYSFTSPASVHDEEALTALELAGRTGKKINEVIDSQNNLESTTTTRLNRQDTKLEQAISRQDSTIKQRLDAQDTLLTNQINHIKNNTVPDWVEFEVHTQIQNGTFDEQIDQSLGGLNERVDNLLGSLSEGSTTLDGEVIDTRSDFTGQVHANAGNAVRSVSTLLSENDKITRNLLQGVSDCPILNGLIDFEPTLTTGCYIEKSGVNMGNINSEVNTQYTFEVTDFLSLEDYPELYISATARYGTCILGVYDNNRNPLGTWGYSEDGNFYSVSDERFTAIDALNISPKARFIRCGSAYSDLRLKLPSRQTKEDTYNELKYTINGNEFEDVSGVGTFSQSLGSYVNKLTGEIVEHEKCYCTGKIPVKNLPDTLFVTSTTMYEVASAVYYDSANNAVMSSSNPVEKEGIPCRVALITTGIIDSHPEIQYVAFSSYGTPLKFETPKKETLQDIAYKVFEYGANNILAGKKLYVAGDSYTAGDFTGVDDLYAEEIFDSKRGMYKTYPYWIAERNNMSLYMDAVNGSTMGVDKTYVADPDNVDINTRNPYSVSRYKNIPSDVDYILLWFGLNDSYNVNLGGASSTTNTDYCGAFNTVLTYIMTNHPDAHIGVVIPNGTTSEEFQEATRNVCKLNGVPYVDLPGDPTIPLILGNAFASAKTKNRRSKQYQVTTTNTHPNIRAHKILANVIESFMRRI